MASSTFTVSRSAKVHAPIDRVAAALATLKDWPAWSPWHDLDPNQTLTYSGPESGVGASSAWVGNRKVGQGSMTVSRVTPTEIDVALHFIKPFKADNLATFALASAGDSTDVTWSMTGKQNVLMKVMGIFMNFDKRIGADFEKGLSRLDAHLSQS